MSAFGDCAACGAPIDPANGVKVDKDRNRLHPGCTIQADAAPEAAQDAPKRRGRPPKHLVAP
jgi:hypothetical protein